MELFYGVLRNLTLLDFWISCLRPSRVDVDLADILRLGLYQLLLAHMPEHAAVYESVELAPKRHRALINAILRSAVRQREDLLTRADAQPVWLKMSHPEFLVARWQQNFGADNTASLCSWNNQPPPVYGRINQLKISPEQFLTKNSNTRALPDLPQFVEFNAFPTDALARGECYIQDPSTRLACELLEARPNETILDACAAPGGKTNYIAEMMENRGTIIACDREGERLHVVQENAQRLGVTIVQTVQHDWTGGEVPVEITSVAPFDRVLIDVPCSNTGVMRRRVDVRWRLRADEFERMHEQQIAIVRATLPLLKRGGALVYSTCSLEPEENQMVVQRLLKEMSILRLEREQDCLPFRDGFDGAFVARFLTVS